MPQAVVARRARGPRAAVRVPVMTASVESSAVMSTSTPSSGTSASLTPLLAPSSSGCDAMVADFVLIARELLPLDFLLDAFRLRGRGRRRYRARREGRAKAVSRRRARAHAEGGMRVNERAPDLDANLTLISFPDLALACSCRVSTSSTTSWLPGRVWMGARQGRSGRASARGQIGNPPSRLVLPAESRRVVSRADRPPADPSPPPRVSGP